MCFNKKVFPMKKYKSAALNDVCLKDPVFAPRVELAVGPMLRAVVEQTEKTGRIGNWCHST